MVTSGEKRRVALPRDPQVWNEWAALPDHRALDHGADTRCAR
jgi:hypothetical protein